METVNTQVPAAVDFFVGKDSHIQLFHSANESLCKDYELLNSAVLVSDLAFVGVVYIVFACTLFVMTW